MTATASVDEVTRLRTLPEQVRKALLKELLMELGDGGPGPIRLKADDGEDLGYYLPPRPKVPRTPPVLTAEEIARGNAALADLGNTVNARELFDRFNREDAAAA